MAVGLGKEDAYFAGLAADLQAKRDRLAAGLARVGFAVLPARGSYFITADFSDFGFNGNDAAFCRALTEQAKVTAIPVSAFYEGEAPGRFIRFAFCKQPEVLDTAIERLAAWRGARR